MPIVFLYLQDLFSVEKLKFMKHILRFSGVLNGHFAIILLSVLFSVCGPTAIAQTTTSTITGNISDGNEPVSDAVVTIVHEPSGIPYYALSNEKGNYVISNILAGGPYTIRVERLNYKTMIMKDVEAPLGEAVVVDVVISPSSVRLEEVTVFGYGLNSPMNIRRSGAGVLLGAGDADDETTEYKYVTLAVNDIPDNQGIVVRFYVEIDGARYYSSYTDENGNSFRGCCASYETLENAVG